MYINKRKSDEMITNKDIMEQGKLVQHYSTDRDPFTGEHGFENLFIYDRKIYSVLTDFTGSIINPTEEPALITDDADAFIDQLFIFEDEEDVLSAQVEIQEDIDRDEAQMWDEILREHEDWLRNDYW